MQVKALDSPEIERRPGCVAEALSVIGNKWTALIVLSLAAGPARFSALEQKVAGIGPRTLSQRLDVLEANNLITRQCFAEVPPRVEYTLTSKGKDIIPILRSMAAWGDKYSK